MRILYSADPEIPVPPEFYGGVQRLVAQVSGEIRRRGHTIGLIAHPESSAEVDSFYPFPGLRSQNLRDTVRNTCALRSAVADFKPDVFHSYSRLMYMVGLLGKDLPKIMSYGREPGGRQVRYAHTLFPTSLTFTACSEHIARKGEHGGGDWNVIYNFVDLEELTFQPTVPDDAPLVFLSRLERVKGAHTAIAIAKACDRRLILAGNRYESGHSARYFEQEIAPEIGKNQIEYVGPVNNEQRDKLLGSAAAMLFPIEWEEPYGLVIAESLACGTPVIATNRGAVPEILRPGKDGFIADSVDQAVEAVSKLRQLKRSDCRSRVEELFTLPRVVDQYEALYRSLLAGSDT